MTRTIISPADLSQKTREILDRVQEGELAVVASEGEERIVLLDALITGFCEPSPFSSPAVTLPTQTAGSP